MEFRLVLFRSQEFIFRGETTKRPIDRQKQCQNHYRKLSLLIYSVSARSTNCRIASALDNTGRRLVRQSSILASHSGEARIWNGCVFISVMRDLRSEEHTSELQSLMRISYAVFCLKKTKIKH